MDPDFSKLQFKYKIWLETDDGQGILGDGKYKLLKTIQQTGSLKLSIDKLGLSYRKTWDNLRKIEDALGFPLIERQRGGATGGKSELTPQGQRYVEVFEKFHMQYDPLIKQFLDDLHSDLQK